jgi:hypothetical protein
MILERLAPRALRTANSFWRAAPRASRRMEQLTQPMMSRRETPARSKASVRPVFCSKGTIIGCNCT